MSAAGLVLPMVWGFGEKAYAERGEDVGCGRKGPRSLRLVQAAHFETEAAVAEAAPAPEPEMAFYRKYTEGMLRRYLTMSMEAGRVPSLLGRELFRGNVTSYKVHGFDDVVIYVHDVEKCMARLELGQQHLIRRIALQGYTQGEAAALLGITLRTVVRRYAEALDRLTAMFLTRGMLKPMVECREQEGRGGRG